MSRARPRAKAPGETEAALGGETPGAAGRRQSAAGGLKSTPIVSNPQEKIKSQTERQHLIAQAEPRFGRAVLQGKYTIAGKHQAIWRALQERSQ